MFIECDGPNIMVLEVVRVFLGIFQLIYQEK